MLLQDITPGPYVEPGDPPRRLTVSRVATVARSDAPYDRVVHYAYDDTPDDPRMALYSEFARPGRYARVINA